MKYGEIERGVSLVDFLAKKLGCVYISDLKYLTADQQKRLASLLEQLPPKAASKAEWDDALRYIEQLPAQKSAEKDRERLLSALRGKRQGKHEHNKR